MFRRRGAQHIVIGPASLEDQGVGEGFTKQSNIWNSLINAAKLHSTTCLACACASLCVCARTYVRVADHRGTGRQGYTPNKLRRAPIISVVPGCHARIRERWARGAGSRLDDLDSLRQPEFHSDLTKAPNTAASGKPPARLGAMPWSGHGVALERPWSGAGRQQRPG